MVNVSDLVYKKSAQLVLGDASTGLDVDDFVAKCIAYMTRDDAGRPTATQRARAGDDEDEDEDDDSTPLDWARLGAEACHPHNARPTLPSFLLGPLSVQKRTRAGNTQRRTRMTQQERSEADRAVVRPEALSREDMDTTESNTLTTVCARIRAALVAHIHAATAAVEALGADVSDGEARAEMARQRLTPTGGPGLFDFVVNPRSFGQTVENLFYVSFLIKEGNVGLAMADDGLPTLRESKPES